MLLVIDQILSLFRSKDKNKDSFEEQAKLQIKKKSIAKVPVVIPISATVNNSDLNSNVLDKNPNLKAQAWTDTIVSSTAKPNLTQAVGIFPKIRNIFKRGNFNKGKTRGVIK